MWEDKYLSDIWRHGSSDRSWTYDCRNNYDDMPKKTKQHTSQNKFSVGDYVRLCHGEARLVVLAVKDGYIKAEYTSRKNTSWGGNVKWRSESDFVLYNSTTKEISKGTTEMKNKLYQTKEATARFGTLLATNSQGKLVLEMKGTGEVLAFDRDEIEVVMPYTFGVKFPNNHTEYHYLGKEGEVEVGDMVMLDNSPTGKFEIARVTSVNTRSEAATVVFKGSKLLTQRIGD